ncbi:MAG: M16 family metallopeptidase, partial [Phenylobacterium sp.]
HISAGSLNEADGQQGLAHFVEHMAFNGSTHVPEGEMVKILERLGLAFGADTNASTGFEETIYKLDLPKTDRETLDTGLMLLRETAGELTFSPPPWIASAAWSCQRKGQATGPAYGRRARVPNSSSRASCRPDDFR